MYMNLLKSLFKIILDFLKVNLWNDFKKALPIALAAFKEALWAELKVSVHACAIEAIAYVEQFYASEELAKKKELILTDICNRIKLPFMLKPFKGLIKKIISDKIDEILAELLHKTKEFFA